jgi:hypothetical protein
MSRPIKFRTWDKIERKMLYFDLYNINCYFEDFNKALLDGLEFILFTGLHDRNGKEIWEGDIVRDYNGETGKVIYGQASFVSELFPPWNWDPMCPVSFLGHGKRLEVIGNIYENPELLEGK